MLQNRHMTYVIKNQSNYKVCHGLISFLPGHWQAKICSDNGDAVHERKHHVHIDKEMKLLICL